MICVLPLVFALVCVPASLFFNLERFLTSNNSTQSLCYSCKRTSFYGSIWNFSARQQMEWMIVSFLNSSNSSARITEDFELNCFSMYRKPMIDIYCLKKTAWLCLSLFRHELIKHLEGVRLVNAELAALVTHQVCPPMLKFSEIKINVHRVVRKHAFLLVNSMVKFWELIALMTV